MVKLGAYPRTYCSGAEHWYSDRRRCKQLSVQYCTSSVRVLFTYSELSCVKQRDTASRVQVPVPEGVAWRRKRRTWRGQRTSFSDWTSSAVPDTCAHREIVVWSREMEQNFRLPWRLSSLRFLTEQKLGFPKYCGTSTEFPRSASSAHRKSNSAADSRQNDRAIDCIM